MTVEHLFCKYYGYKIHEFRQLGVKEVKQHLPLLIISSKMGPAIL